MRNKKDLSTPYKRIVIKLGTSLLTGNSDRLDMAVITGLAAQVAELHKKSIEVIIVSSGAVAAGRQKLGMSRKKIPGIPFKQVLASVGQSRLMNVYEQVFEPHDIAVAQALLTKQDLTDRSGYLNTRNTLIALMELGVIAIVNENDVVAVDELHEHKFGDNDNLSAMVANLVDADLLLILSDIAGLFTSDPHKDANAKLIPVVEQIDSSIEALCGDTSGKQGTGGMITKIEAAKLATASGVTVIITNGHEPRVIERIASGEALGTRFLPAATRLESRERWMLSGLATRGKLVVDTGAARAMKTQNGSLLAAGILSVEGEFVRGDIVEVCDPQGERLGCGICNYSTADIETIKGANSRKIAELLGFDFGSEVVHRNNFVKFG